MWETALCSTAGEGQSFWPSPAKQDPKPWAGWPRSHLEKKPSGNWNSKYTVWIWGGEVYVTKLFCKRVSAYQGILFSCMTRGVPNAETATRSSKAQRERRGRTPCWSCQSPRAPAWDLLQVGRDEPRDSTIHCWKTCLLLTAWYLKREVNALKSLIQWY